MPTFSTTPDPSSPFASVKGDHAGLRVADIDAALAWYRDTLDFRHTGGTVAGGLQYAFMAPADDDSFQIELIGGQGAADRPSSHDLYDSLGLHGWHHLCLRVENVDAALTELRHRNVDIIGGPFDVADIQRRIAFFHDPWGNVFELTQKIGT